MNCSFITIACSTTSDYVLKALPTISAEYVEFAEKLKSTFTGDPSFFAYNGDEEETQQDEEVLLKHLIYDVPNAYSITLRLAFQLLFYRWTFSTLIALHASSTALSCISYLLLHCCTSYDINLLSQLISKKKKSIDMFRNLCQSYYLL
jgi:hypothetical protein